MHMKQDIEIRAASFEDAECIASRFWSMKKSKEAPIVQRIILG